MWGYDYRKLVSRKLGLSQDLVQPRNKTLGFAGHLFFLGLVKFLSSL